MESTLTYLQLSEMSLELFPLRMGVLLADNVDAAQ